MKPQTSVEKNLHFPQEMKLVPKLDKILGHLYL